jgi:hypothetical protein
MPDLTTQGQLSRAKNWIQGKNTQQFSCVKFNYLQIGNQN